MSQTRRNFLRASATAAVAASATSVFPRPLLAKIGGATEPIPPIQDPRVKELTQRALDAARQAGATYADVRLAYTRTRIVSSDYRDFEAITVGIRALVNGYWGFAVSPIWSTDEMVRLSKGAVHQAKANVLGKQRTVDLSPLSAIADGHWTTPIEIDPFLIHPDEIIDYLASLSIYIRDRVVERKMKLDNVAQTALFTVQEKAFASTEGSFCTQRQYVSSGAASFFVTDLRTGRKDSGTLDLLLPATLGWELYRKQPLREEIEQILDEIKADCDLPMKPVDIGRYNVVFDAYSFAHLISKTIGAATELDRAMGYEANAGGTSYLNDPVNMLGTFKIGSPLLTVTANRTARGGAATVRWDDEGVTSSDFSIVKDGVLTEFSATREGMGWVQEYYAKKNIPAQPRGCAVGGRDLLGGMYAPLTQTPNLVLTPGKDALDYNACLSELDKGIAFRRMTVDMDFQQLNGLAMGKAYEVKDGKRVALLGGAGTLFRAPELWKGLTKLGGPESAQRFGMTVEKGEPPQKAYHSVTAVPGIVKDVTIVDVMRKA
jgi:TldD protein